MKNEQKILGTILTIATIAFIFTMYWAFNKQIKDEEIRDNSRIQYIESVVIEGHRYVIIKVDSTEYFTNENGIVKHEQ